MKKTAVKTAAPFKKALGSALKNNFHVVLIVISLAFMIAVACVASELCENAINNEKNAVFNKPWMCSVDDGPFEAVSLPLVEEKASSHITLKNYLPGVVIKGATVLIKTSQQNIAVSIGDELIYSTFAPEKTEITSSSAYHFVRLPTESVGKEITIILKSPYARYSGMVSQIYIGSKASNLFFLLRENGARLAVGLLVLTVGVMLVLAFLFAKRQGNSVGIVYLGAFFACAGYWIAVESKMLQIILPYPMAMTNSSIFALSLLPVFLGMYYYSTQHMRLKKLMLGVTAVMMTLSAAIGVIAVAQPSWPLYILPFYLIALAVYIVFTFGAIMYVHVSRRARPSLAVVGIGVFAVCCLIELAVYLSDTRAYHNSDFLILGVILLCVILVADAIRTFTKVYQSSIRVEALTVLAYTDSLTQLPNRTAFLEKISNIDMNHSPMVTLGMFDINNLKLVNDTMGHLVGDAMIRHSVKAIKKSIREDDELYRIGGDEFVAILCHDKPIDVVRIKARLVSILKAENSVSLSYSLSIAYGYATFAAKNDRNLLDTLARADKIMYECKAAQKAVVR